jgi:hypothetical protein
MVEPLQNPIPQLIRRLQSIALLGFSEEALLGHDAVPIS